MRAIVAYEVGGPEVLTYTADHPTPTPGANEILVKNTFAGLNYIDTYFRRGIYPSKKPEILGREASGTIASIGTSVPSTSPSLKIGDPVVWTNWTGGYAEYTAVPYASVVKIPAGIRPEVAAGGYLMGLTALSLLSESYPVKKGDEILIHAAAGGTGKLMVQYAKSLGAYVIGTAGGEEKCKLALANGADEVIDYKQYPRKEDWVPKVLALTRDGAGVNAVFDGVGKDTYDGSLDVVRRKGSVVIFGASSGAVPDISLRRLQAKNSHLLRPTMTLYMATREETEYYSRLFFEAVEKGVLKVEIDGVYDLFGAEGGDGSKGDVKQAHVDLEGRRTKGKVLLRV